jgi:superfamily II DNA or RNA helicase
MCTGSGKSIVAIEIIKKLFSDNCKICLIVPTEKLRDHNWEQEFKKSNCNEIYKTLDRFCYASIAKISGKTYDLVILDEAHRITENNFKFFESNIIKHVIGLTATLPENDEKLEMLTSIAPIAFEYSLSQGIKDGIISPFNIKIIETRLDNKEKYIEMGKVNEKYLVTEKYNYDRLTAVFKRAIMTRNSKFIQIASIKRMHMLYGLKSKMLIAKQILNTYLCDKKVLIFCGSIDQATEICEHTYHSKSGDKDLKRFINDEISVLSCVRALNEGMNIPNVDAAIIVQLNSKQLDLIQRIGRVVRFRKNHIADIYILSCVDTQDEVWTNKATEGFSNIEYINVKNL